MSLTPLIRVSEKILKSYNVKGKKGFMVEYSSADKAYYAEWREGDLKHEIMIWVNRFTYKQIEDSGAIRFCTERHYDPYEFI